MAILQLLQDGSCGVQQTCLSNADDVHASCPQLFKCGTCVAWTPREKNRFTRNSGQCLLDRSSTQYLDCNAAICPYYKPRADSPAAAQWQQRPVAERTTEVRRRTGTMTREAPPPSREAIATAAFRQHDDATAAIGASVLAAMLGDAAMPALLERFRGGSARLVVGTDHREVPIEAFWARVVLLRRALENLHTAIEASSLDADTRGKIDKDIGGMGGSMTTFNLLFAKKEDAFKGSGKADEVVAPASTTSKVVTR
jgi:hypothetical protein